MINFGWVSFQWRLMISQVSLTSWSTLRHSSQSCVDGICWSSSIKNCNATTRCLRILCHRFVSVYATSLIGLCIGVVYKSPHAHVFTMCEFHTKASEFIAQLVGGTSIVDRWQAHWWNCALFDLPPFWFDDGYKLALGTRRSTLKLAVFSVRRGRTGRVRATCTRPAPKSFLWVPLLTSFLSMPSLVWSFFLDIWWKIRKW